MEFKSTLSEADLDGLFNQGKIKDCNDPRALDLQIQQLEKLSFRINAADPVGQFLAIYDSIMRLAEIQVVLNGYLFDSAPHVAMRQIVLMICPETSDYLLKRLSSIRHLAKKNNVTPLIADIRDLDNVRALLEVRTSTSGS